MTPDERELLLMLVRALNGNLPLPDFWRGKINTLALAVERAGNMTSAGK